MKRMLEAMLLLVAISASCGARSEASSSGCVPKCENIPCGAECWEIRVLYHRDGVPTQTSVGGLWGSISGATCWADHVSVNGFWIPEGELQPTKVPPGALDLIIIDRAVIIKEDGR